MNKTIQQLKSERIHGLIILGLSLILLAIFLFWLKAEDALIIILILGLEVIFLYVINQNYARKAGKRLTYLAADMMDAQLLCDETKEAYKRKSTNWKKIYGEKYSESTCYSLQGDYDNALKAWEEIPALNQKYANSKLCGRAMILVRMGNLEEAEKSLQKIVEIESSDRAMSASCCRVLGAYYTSIGDTEEARTLLDKAMKSAKYNTEKMGLFFDLARLEEKSAHDDKAAEYYRQAAEIGPKTWLGQQSARKAEALAAGGENTGN